MDFNLTLGVAGFLLSVMSLLYAVYVTRRSRRDKRLVYETMKAVPIAEVVPGQRDYALRVVYERPDQPPVYVQHAYVQYCRFTNFGRVAVRTADIAETDPIRIEITGGAVLDVSLTAVTRETCRIALSEALSTDSMTSVPIRFEFLDNLDGALVQVLSDSPDVRAAIKGTVVEMPNGIQEARGDDEGTVVGGWGCAIFALIEAVSLGVVAFLYWLLTGGWDGVALLALPALAVILPVLVLIAWLSLLGPRAEFDFPEQLLPPRWYDFLRLRASAPRGARMVD